VNFALSVPAKNDRFLAHGGHEEIARLAYLAFVSYEQPSPREELLLLLGINLWTDEHFPVDGAGIQVHHAIYLSDELSVLAVGSVSGCHVGSPP